MPASERGFEEVLPATNHRSSPTTARRKTRFVVSSGRMSSGGCEGSDEGRDSLNFICAGANIEYVPVPVRSGRCSPSWRISRIRFRYWYSSCAGWDAVLEVPFVDASLTDSAAWEGVITGSMAVILIVLGRCVKFRDGVRVRR